MIRALIEAIRYARLRSWLEREGKREDRLFPSRTTMMFRIDGGYPTPDGGAVIPRFSGLASWGRYRAFRAYLERGAFNCDDAYSDDGGR